MKKARNRAAVDFIDHGSASYTFLQDPIVDALMQVVVELGMEGWTTRRRLMVLERVLDANGLLPAETIETYVPTEQDRAEWRQERDRMVKTIYAALARRPDVGDQAAQRAKAPNAPRKAPRPIDGIERPLAKGPSGV
jgi:hypothetical protein